MDRLKKQFDFILEIDKEKQIVRQNYLADGSRKENDSEHAWHMAIMALLLHKYSTDAVDVGRVIAMLLIHDLVEIDAGDTYAYDEEGQSGKQAKEEAAAKRIFGILPEDQAEDFMDLWQEFENGITANARFANALDSLQPMMLNGAAGGKSWVEHGVKLSQILKRNDVTAQAAPELWEFCFKEFVKPNLEAGKIVNE
ncbi:putative hydrolase of HD superfamily [Aequitasia blattaphilus]|uniref:HD domain-containing protein n=1 Tax=Aequitasia blattaphilus TaxID=2949332 RepID=A0ABT1E924_9FIRM|nr:HD domain-containing protein [Aequitasia blattaphilus]MCP1102273.1 HD domain-containing protein [Aequitasia blattaphilus]MCR8614913.1 HD domain-containing protein [Aequitasia blattaphilus]